MTQHNPKNAMANQFVPNINALGSRINPKMVTNRQQASSSN
jgi:hypothetical protein